MMRAPVSVLVGFVLAGALTACSGGSTSLPQQPSGSTATAVTIARPADVVTLDPAAASDNASIWTTQLLYSTLYVPSADGKSLQPGLARTTKRSPDGLTTTITLRPDATFSDGKKITAADVKFSLERNLKPDAGWSFIYTLVKKVEAPDDATVVIRTSKPMAAFESSLALFASAVVPKDLAGQSAEAFFARPVSSGPFVLDSWSKGEKMVLKANPAWTSPALTTKQVVFTVVPDDNARVLQLRGGQVDAVEAPPASQMSSLGTEDVEAKSFPSTYAVNLSLNQAKGPFADIDVRRAVAQSIDREGILKAAFFGSGKPAGAFLTSGVPLWSATKIPAFDPAAAKASLAKSGFASGFSTDLVIPSGDASLNTTAQAIQEALKPLNIRVNVKPVESTAYFGDYFLAGKFDMSLVKNSSDVPDPDEIVSAWANSKWFVNADSDRDAALAAQAASELDPTKRAALYAQILNSYTDQMIGLPMFDLTSDYAWRAGTLPNFSVTVLGSYDLASFR